MPKKSGIKKILFWNAVIMVGAIVIMLGIFAIRGDYKVFFGQSAGKIIEEKRISDKVKNIDISTVSEDISVIKENRDDINVVFKGSKRNAKQPKLNVEVKSDNLHIETTHTNKILNFEFNFFSINSLKIELHVPAEYNGDLKCKSISGDIKTDNFTLKNAKFESTSGDIKIDGLTVDSVKIKSISGDINIKELSSKDTVCNLTSGDIKINQYKGSKIDINGISGDIQLDAIEFKDIDIKTVSGDSQISLPKEAVFNLDYDTTSGDIKNSIGFNRNSDNVIKCRSTSGDFEISKR